MSQRTYCEFTCDGCKRALREPAAQHPQMPQPLPAGWKAVTIDGEPRRDFCEDCREKIRNVFGGKW